MTPGRKYRSRHDGNSTCQIEPYRRILPNTVDADQATLRIGGHALCDLAERFGTPLYVYDEDTLRGQARRIRAAFEHVGARISFAAKACSTLAVLRVMQEEGLGLDTVSAGEIEAGIRAGFRPSDIHLHGNAKPAEELSLAVRMGLRAVVVDNVDELKRLEGIVDRVEQPVRVMLRVAVSKAADVHPHVRTSGRATKFGLARRDLAHALERLTNVSKIDLVGLHAHAGSQITDPTVYRSVLGQLMRAAGLAKAIGLSVGEASIGGGWAVPYQPDDAELPPEIVAEQIAEHVLPETTLAIEPGRALVARAAVAVYRVLGIKTSGRGRVIAVDGGMRDNPRPALYGASYAALPATNPGAAGKGRDRVVGRYCEEGDVLASGVHLDVQVGDLIAIPVSGAYQLSMASAYNLVPPPAAVMVSDGDVRVIARRADASRLLEREQL